MTRFVRVAAYAAIAVITACAEVRIARAQADPEAAPDAGPEWTKSETYRPARRFRATANLLPESKAIMESIKSGAYYGMPSNPGFGRGGARAGTYEAPPPPPPRKKSGAPGIVAGLVFERADKRPVAGVNLQLVSTEANFALEKLVARTDSAGYYEFKDVEPGRWYLSVVTDRLNPKYAPLRAGVYVTVA